MCFEMSLRHHSKARLNPHSIRNLDAISDASLKARSNGVVADIEHIIMVAFIRQIGKVFNYFFEFQMRSYETKIIIIIF